MRLCIDAGRLSSHRAAIYNTDGPKTTLQVTSVGSWWRDGAEGAAGDDGLLWAVAKRATRLPGRRETVLEPSARAQNEIDHGRLLSNKDTK